MKVDTMRNIDRYAGVPITFLLGLVYRLIYRFAPRKQVAVKNALFIELSEMGSAIIADPAMRKLREDTGAQLHFVIFKKNAISLSLLRTIPEENIYLIREDNLWWFALDVLGFLVWCRRRHIDTVIDLELFSRATSILTALSGATNRAGFHRGHDEGLYRGEFLSHPVTYNSHVHVSVNFMSLVQVLSHPPEEPPYNKSLISQDQIVLAQAEVSERDRELMQGRVREIYAGYGASVHRLLLVNANASDLLPQRRWMPERFVEVIRRMLETHDDLLVVMTGSASEKEQSLEICALVDDPRCLNSAGFFLFEELTALYSIADAMLSNDSGPPHFASITPLKTFVLFGPETPSLYGSLGNSESIYAGLACSPCVSAFNHRKTSCTDNQCLRAISTDQVVARLERYFQQVIAIG
jgi:ADP-heptose:LPS heptosyltransferase